MKTPIKDSFAYMLLEIVLSTAAIYIFATGYICLISDFIKFDIKPAMKERVQILIKQLVGS